MLSVLIPVFNVAVCKLVQTVYEQAATCDVPFEVLIADDASTNQNIKQQNRFCEENKYGSVFELSQNKGRAATRQFLAQKARYDYLLFLDADVQPTHTDFIARFLKQRHQADLIFGGLTYSSHPPKKDKRLRWKYGKVREAKLLNERRKKPYYSIVSGALFVRKEVFLQANSIRDNRYGLDAVFVHNLKQNNAKVLHTDNPVVHIGLEKSAQFLAKTREGLHTLVFLEKQRQTANDYRPVQKTYRKLASCGLTPLFCHLFNVFQSRIQKNLLGANPSLFLFDLYKLDFYIRLKKRHKELH